MTAELGTGEETQRQDIRLCIEEPLSQAIIDGKLVTSYRQSLLHITNFARQSDINNEYYDRRVEFILTVIRDNRNKLQELTSFEESKHGGHKKKLTKRDKVQILKDRNKTIKQIQNNQDILQGNAPGIIRFITTSDGALVGITFVTASEN